VKLSQSIKTGTAIAILAVLSACVSNSIPGIVPDGTAIVSTLAGSGIRRFSDGWGRAVGFTGPHGIAIDTAGNLYVTDGRRIRKITPKGEVSTFAGSNIQFEFDFGSVDGQGNDARFFFLTDITIDAAGNLYVTDGSINNIRKVTPAGVVSTLAGGCGYDPGGIAIDAAGNLYNIRNKVTPEGVVRGGCPYGDFADGEGSNARFNQPNGIAVDTAGNLYVADQYNHRIRKVTPQGGVSTLAGSNEGGFADGEGSAARFNQPNGIAIDAAGNLYVADTGNNRIRKITSKGEVSTFAGGDEDFAGGDEDFAGGDEDFAGGDEEADCTAGLSVARFNGPWGITMDAAGNLYVTDIWYHRVYKVTPDGKISALAGGCGYGDFADGEGSNARFNHPIGIAIDAAGNLYVADSRNRRIRKIEIRRP
jgi:sugar lactone lactonase YvrE